MTLLGWVQIAFFIAVLSLLVVPLGSYIARVFARPPTALERRLLRPEPQDWKAYARSALVFSGVCVLALYLTLRTQGLHPFNPNGFHSGTGDVSFNTAISFITTKRRWRGRTIRLLKQRSVAHSPVPAGAPKRARTWMPQLQQIHSTA